MSKTWSLEDVTLIAKEAPYTFYLPSKSVINQLQVGSVVKLMFNCNVENEQGWSAERMWVIITEVNDGYYKGTLDNDPSYIPDIKYQDIVEFESKHIMQTDIEESESDIVEKYNPRCYVTSHVLKDGFPVGQLYREKPEENENNYSGWTLFSGLENEEYLNNSENWNFVSLGAVLNQCDRFASLLELEDYEHEFTWDESISAYVKI
ncbi:immunity protein Imm33 domain-containing protein [Thalassotalea agarivorans]|uniref:DUF2185 domain-containing protein n=1 Tax=Thalassotalea agarivorans TaxID=349064 RepID=A0A1I0HXB0_THASX|nr:DUF2185 domain-containing protein [Thalassotalea agarivorans]SET88718.1 hypothetical protein SAMN05660429_02968 [Thalassotalea agarivorans]